MRISDWSSDVCSTDLTDCRGQSRRTPNPIIRRRRSQCGKLDDDRERHKFRLFHGPTVGFAGGTPFHACRRAGGEICLCYRKHRANQPFQASRSDRRANPLEGCKLRNRKEESREGKEYVSRCSTGGSTKNIKKQNKKK